MNRMIAQLSLVVRDYDEAIAFYVSKLGFVLIEDTRLSETKRWVVVAPSADAAGCKLLLAQAVGAEQSARVGDQTGGRVFLFMHTDDIARDHARLVAAGVRVVREPAVQPYGTVLVFEDLYGNLWDLIEPVTNS
jgi:catechol 2,3-dioxygenase-like lactoylglutathione lyase family enzyme